MNKTFLYIFLLVFTITTWGYSWVLMKMGLGYAEPFTFAAWRCAIGGVAMIIFVRVKSIEWPKLEKLPDYLMIAIFQTTLMFGLMLYGMKYVTAGKTSVLLYTMPIWTIFLVHFYLKERLNRGKWLGVALGTIGIVCILGWDTLVHQNSEILFGELLIIGGAISWAVSNIWVKKRMGGENIYMVSSLQLSIGAIGLALLAIPTEGILNIEWNAHSIYILLFTGLIASAVDFTIWFYLLKNLDIKITTFSSMLVPVFGLIFDWAILGNRLDGGVIVGGALILIGIYQVSRK
ncbi:MAG: DMT family transporter [Candidatus Dadabacteria bacterium]|nr:MAG: DMT family transporter [Candidatus Dadabacteria bacterium]TDI98726.1 MAG: DMT family transporter [Candidatus Dadabacteria bacterium]